MKTSTLPASAPAVSFAPSRPLFVLRRDPRHRWLSAALALLGFAIGAWLDSVPFALLIAVVLALANPFFLRARVERAH